MRLLLLLTLLFTHVVHGETILSPFREGQSNYVSEKKLKNSQKQFKGQDEVLVKTIDQALITLLSDGNELTYDQIQKALARAIDSLAVKTIDLRYKYEHALNLMRGHDLIDDVLYRLLRDYFEQYYYQEQIDETHPQRPEGPAMPLKNYIVKKEAFKRNFSKLSKYKDEVVPSSEPNPFPKKKFEVKAANHRELSTRERLFYLYTPAQVREMAIIMDNALSIADAKNVFTTIELRNGSAPMIINHSTTEQYRLALRIMRMQKEEAEVDKGRLGTYVSDLDLIASAYEMGILSYEEVSLVANNEDFYSPELSLAKKSLRYIGNLASIALRVHPATAAYAIIPLMLYNSYSEVKKTQAKIDEDSFIFSLPKRN